MTKVVVRVINMIVGLDPTVFKATVVFDAVFAGLPFEIVFAAGECFAVQWLGTEEVTPIGFDLLPSGHPASELHS